MNGDSPRPTPTGAPKPDGPVPDQAKPSQRAAGEPSDWPRRILSSAPWTFAGVARLAAGWRVSFWLAVLIAGLLVASGAEFVLVKDWVPALRTAISNLPARAEIRGGKIAWPASAPPVLAETKFISITVDVAGNSQSGQVSDVTWKFEPAELRVYSLCGDAALPYPRGWTIQLNRQAVEPWFGAWELPLLAGSGMALGLCPVGFWMLAGAIYAPPAKLMALLSRRRLTWPGAWRLGIAAQIPGACLLALALVLYGLQWINLIWLLLGAAVSLASAWIYIPLVPFQLERRPPKANPFAAGRNPFAGCS